MKWVFVIIFVAAVLLSVIAVVTLPKHRADDVVCTLVWATDDNPARAEQMELFRQWYREKYGEKIDIRIDPAAAWDYSKIVVQSIAGAGPDLFDFFGMEGLERLLSSGILLDVTDTANAKGFGRDAAWESIWTSFVFDGRQYGFPDNVTADCILYHKKQFEKAGLPLPSGDWTWDEFLAVAKHFSYARGQGLRQYAILDLDPLVMIYQNGGTMFTPEGTRCCIDSPEAIEALQFFDDLRRVHKVMPTAAELASQSAAGGWGGNWINLFATGYFTMAAAGRWWFIGLARDASAAIAEGKPSPYDIGVAPMPYFKKKYVRCGARVTGISRTSKNITYALRFLEYLASEPFNRQINRTFDALAPAKKYCTGPSGIADGPAPPPGLEAANDPMWTTVMEYAREADRSPFIPPYRVGTLWWELKGSLDAGDVSPEQMLHTLAARINEEIRRNVKKDPALRARYEEALARENNAASAAVN